MQRCPESHLSEMKDHKYLPKRGGSPVLGGRPSNKKEWPILEPLKILEAFQPEKLLTSHLHLLPYMPDFKSRLEILHPATRKLLDFSYDMIFYVR